MPPRTSALWTTKVPAKVTGVEPPDMAIGDHIHGTPSLTESITLAKLQSQPQRLVGQALKVKIGRSLSLSLAFLAM